MDVPPLEPGVVEDDPLPLLPPGVFDELAEDGVEEEPLEELVSEVPTQIHLSLSVHCPRPPSLKDSL